jgi:hypothetical protein
MDARQERTRKLALYGWIGLAVILAAEILLFLRIRPVPSFFTPIVWSGYILFIDALIGALQGRSLIRDRFGEFLLMLPLSLVFWVIFELYNSHIQNWRYIGMPENLLVRGLGYVWSFATILPAVLLTARLMEWVIGPRARVPAIAPGRTFQWALLILGAVFLLVPALVPATVARYLVALIWLGFILMLEPTNYRRGGWSLMRDWERGNAARLLALCASGLVCGLLWEFWNYWAATKWIYTVPLPLGPKVFEMPLGGYLGFIPFAVECHIMYAFVLTLRRKPWFPEREI